MNRMTVITLLLVVTLAPILLRSAHDAPLTPGPESYAQIRDAELVLAGTFTNPLTGDRIVPAPGTFLLAAMGVLGVPWLLPGLLLSLFLLLLWIFVHRFTSEHLATLVCLLFLVTPVASTLGTHHSTVLLSLVLVLCGLLARNPILAGVSLALAGVVDLPMGIAGVIASLVVARMDVFRSLATLIAFLCALGWHAAWGLPISIYAPGQAIFELGALSGVSLFLLVLALLGAFLAPKLFSGLGALLLAITLVSPTYVAIATIVFSLLAAYAVNDLVRHAWELELLRQITLVIVFCIGIFLVITCVRIQVHAEPTPDFKDALLYLRTTHREGAVLTDPALAPLVEILSKRRAALNDPNEGALLRSRNAPDVYDTLERTSTSHILLTDEMRRTYFSSSDEGLLFLLPNSDRFIHVRTQGTVDLWYYIPR